MSYFIFFAGVYSCLLAPGSKSDVIFRLLQFSTIKHKNIARFQFIHTPFGGHIAGLGRPDTACGPYVGQSISWPACRAEEEGNRRPYLPSTFQIKAGPHSPVLGNMKTM